MLLSTYPQRGAEVNHQHAARQAYIGGMSAPIIAAAFEEVDSTPWKASTPPPSTKSWACAPGPAQRGHLPLGYRADEGDWLVNLKKVRRPTEQFVTTV